MTAYEWLDGRDWHSFDAQPVGESIEKIRLRDGICTPPALVEFAKPKRSPVHDLIFRDDDATAAYKHRLQIARACINSVAIVDAEGEKQPAFIHVRVEQAQGYVSQADIRENDDYRESAIMEAKKYLRGAKARYAWIAELSPIWEAIEELDRERIAA